MKDVDETGRARLEDVLAGTGQATVRGVLRPGEMPGGRPIEVPYTVVRGSGTGPVAWVVGARDGDEVHAALIAMELQRRLVPDGVTGAVVVIPVVNVPGFEVLSRSHPLAPSYLGSDLDSFLFRLVTARPGYLVDLHSAGASADTVDWTLCLEGDRPAEEMALAFGSAYLYLHRPGTGSGPHSTLLDGALFTRSTRAGVPAVLIEAGGGLPPDGTTVQRGADGVTNVLRHLGVMDGAPRPAADPIRLHGFRIVTPRRGGIMENDVGLGEAVDEGRVLGRVFDLYGSLVEEVRAPVAGVVLTISLNPASGTGTWAFELGW